MLRINPIYKKELKQNARMSKTAFMLFFYNALLAVFGLFALFLIFNNNQKKGYHIDYSDILKIYGIIIGVEYILVLVIIPAMTAGSISGEREKQTLEILLTTKVTTLQIVVGKLASSISMMILLAFSSLPIVAVVFSIGGITLIDLVEFMLSIIVTAIFLGSIGIFFSALCKKTTAATVCSYMTVLFITGGLALLLIGADLLNAGQAYNLGLETKNSGGNQYGDIVLVILINPIFSFLSLLNRQTGIGSNMSVVWKAGNQIRYFIADHWVECSYIVQIVISIVLLVGASRLLRPKKEK